MDLLSGPTVIKTMPNSALTKVATRQQANTFNRMATKLEDKKPANDYPVCALDANRDLCL
jgi:CRISPR/Cas system-associated protein Csx1